MIANCYMLVQIEEYYIVMIRRIILEKNINKKYMKIT